jgi:hypothetical protein
MVAYAGCHLGQSTSIFDSNLQAGELSGLLGDRKVDECWVQLYT